MNYLCFEQDELTLFNAQKMNKILCFKYSPFKIYEVENKKMRSPDINFSALIGVKILDDIPFLIIAEQAQPCCNIGAATIFQIKKIDWIPIVKKQQIQSVLDKREERLKDMSKLFDDGHHYFSDIYRVYTTYYYNIIGEQNANEKKFYSQFIYNQGLMVINQQSTIESWCKPIIQGYIQQFTCRVTQNQKISYTLISRRSNKKQGTRYFARGIDDKGNVANFTETQQIITYGKFIISNVQIRGSVPAFFEQIGISGLSGQLKISRNQALTEKAFKTHFSKLNSVYGRIFCVNLLSIKKSEQQKLTLFFQNLISMYSPEYLRYEYFDFHQQCKNNQFQNAQRLVEKVKKIISGFGVTVFDTQSKKLVSKQSGVFRTNCLDCLDRTNYMQSRIALQQFKRVIVGFSPPQVRQQITRMEVFKNKIQDSSSTLKAFNSAWADNGDKISLHYTGIGSTHTDITKNGKRTFKGTVNHKMRSLMRFFVQFTDSKKHQAIQTIVANPLMRSTSIQAPSIQGQFMNIVLLSFDLNDLKGDLQFTQFTQSYVQLKRPAGVVIYAYKKPQSGILNMSLNLLKGKKPHTDINTFAQQQVAVVRKLGYQVVKKVLNDSSCMLILGNQFLIKNITQIKNENVTHNKDSMTICKFNIYQSSMVFAGVNCNSFQNFIDLVQKSHEEAFQHDKLGQAKSSSILAHSYRTILGNCASGNRLSKQLLEQIRQQLQYMKKKGDTKGMSRIISQVLDGDQLANSFSKNYQYLKNYMQGPVYFVADRNRIMFWNKQQLITKVLDYNVNPASKCTYGHLSYQLH